MTATVSRIGSAKSQPSYVTDLRGDYKQHPTARHDAHPTAAVQQFRATNPKWVARAKTEAKTFFGCMAIGAVFGFVFGLIAQWLRA